MKIRSRIATNITKLARTYQEEAMPLEHEPRLSFNVPHGLRIAFADDGHEEGGCTRTGRKAADGGRREFGR